MAPKSASDATKEMILKKDVEGLKRLWRGMLRSYLEKAGETLDDRWEVQVSFRSDGFHADKYFHHPDYPRCRSYKEVLNKLQGVKSPSERPKGKGDSKLDPEPEACGKATKENDVHINLVEDTYDSDPEDLYRSVPNGKGQLTVAGEANDAPSPTKELPKTDHVGKGVVAKQKQPKSTGASMEQKTSTKTSDTEKRKLTRAEAQQAAMDAIRNLPMPHKGKCGTLVTDLGKFDPRPKYRSKQRLFPVGYTANLPLSHGAYLQSQIMDGGDSGPLFRVALTLEEGTTQELATARTMEAVWQAVVTKQNHYQQPEPAADSVMSDSRDPAFAKTAEVLAAAPSFDSMSAMDWYGLGSEIVLKALEGLDGVADCSEYTYVAEQRQWRSHMAGARKSVGDKASGVPRPGAGLQKHDKQPSITNFMARSGQEITDKKRKRESDTALPRDSAPSKASKTQGRGAKDENAVKAFMKSLISKVESNIAQEKQKSKTQTSKVTGSKDTAEKMQRMSRPRLSTPLEQDDLQLPDADRAPPQFESIPWADKLEPAFIPGMLELWQLIGHFQETLSLQTVPSIAELIESAVSPTTSESGVFSDIMVALTDCVLVETMDAALEVCSLSNEDIRPKEYKAAYPEVNQSNWLEMARRIFVLASAGMLIISSKEHSMSGGLDIALGDYVGHSPIGTLGPSVVLQGLMAGAIPENPFATSAALPMGACSSSASVRTTWQDVQVHQSLLREVETACNDAVPEFRPETIIMCRRILRHIAKVKGSKTTDGTIARASAMFFDGDKAAVAAKWAQPQDLHTLSLKNDLGLYARLKDGIQVFVSDVEDVCNMFLAASRNKRSEFAHTLQGMRTAEIAEKVRDRVQILLPQALSGSLIDPPGGKINQKKKAPPGEAELETAEDEDLKNEAAEDKEEEEGKTAGAEADPNSQVPEEEDLSRPLILVEGCCVCWKNEDTSRILLCDSCDEEYHSYCLHPPLTDTPAGDWYCPSCEAESNDCTPQPIFQQSLISADIPDNPYASLANALRSKELSDLTLEQRLNAAFLMAGLFECSSEVRGVFSNAENSKKELYTQLRDLRIKVKQYNREQAEKAKNPEKAAAEEAALKPRTRQVRDPELEQASDQSRIVELEKQLNSNVWEVRLEPIGHDRLWNRYWVLGSWDSTEPGTLFVEHAANGWFTAAQGQEGSRGALKMVPKELQKAEVHPPAPSWGCYQSRESLKALIAYLNPSGPREGKLRTAVQRHLQKVTDQEQQPVEEDLPVQEEAVAQEQAQDGAEGMDAQEEDPNHADDQPAERCIIGLEPDVQEGSSIVNEASSSVAYIQADLLHIIEDLRDSNLSSVRASKEAVALWKNYLEQASTPEGLMAALLLAEYLIPAEQLKPWWRLWGFPLPSFTNHATLAGIRLRMRALKAALKKANQGPSRFSRSAVAAQDRKENDGGRYSFRANRAPAGALAEASFTNTVADDYDFDYQRLDTRTKPSTKRASPPLQLLQDSNGAKATRAAARQQHNRLDPEHDEEKLGSEIGINMMDSNADPKSISMEIDGEDSGKPATTESNSIAPDQNGHDMHTLPSLSEHGQQDVVGIVPGLKRLCKAIN